MASNFVIDNEKDIISWNLKSKYYENSSNNWWKFCRNDRRFRA
ncbi:LCI fold-containing protein [Winogradskyella aurantiaca]